MSVIMAMLAGGISALQRGFRASHDFAQSHAEQVRVCDYLQRDCRSASEVQVYDGGSRVILKLPTEEPGLLSLNLPSSVMGLLGVSGGPTTKAVTYNFMNGRLARTEEGGATQIIATHLSGFKVESSGAQLRTTISFLSTYGGRTTAQEMDATRSVSIISVRAVGN